MKIKHEEGIVTFADSQLGTVLLGRKIKKIKQLEKVCLSAATLPSTCSFSVSMFLRHIFKLFFLGLFGMVIVI